MRLKFRLDMVKDRPFVSHLMDDVDDPTSSILAVIGCIENNEPDSEIVSLAIWVGLAGELVRSRK